jgi:acyl-CoA synthetase (AMP-forming)/AMP-acid ligase II/1-acyl-sn-glycerol-3-phosphate acyltransferase/acyl carrier protein
MITAFWFCVTRLLLWLRYRVRVRGADKIASRGTRGILFLPNHPALIDPIITTTFLRQFKARPLADRDQIDRPLIRRLARRIRAIAIPDLAKQGTAAGEEVRQTIAACVEALRSGDNLILYPSGRNQRTRFEDIRAGSAVETILKELPEARVVLVRMRGLWGSRFSWASGEPPSVGAALKHGLKMLLANGIFFSPRRDVTMELVEPDDVPRTADRNTLNRYLEAFYNADAPPNTFVPYTPWQRGGVRQMPEPASRRIEGDLDDVPAATRRIVCEQLQKFTGGDEFDDADLLARDLGLDSLSKADLLLWLQAEFGFAQSDVESLVSVGDVMLAACGESPPAGPVTVDPPASVWFRRPASPEVPAGLAEMTITEAFLLQARRQPKAAVVADQASGVKTYREIVLALLALTPVVETIPGPRVGVMMPASVGADVLYLATLFAGKTPVMVNWTQGPGVLEHCLDAVGAEHVLTARALVTRLESSGIDLSAVRDRFVFVEDLGRRLSRWAKLRAWLASRLSWRTLDRATPPATAAILFTSGSENLPKVVPLTHRNILNNVADAFACVDLTRNDSILGMLPAFHAFGLATGIAMSLCLGLRAVYYPNPTEGGALGRVIEAYRASMAIGTPTFINGIVRSSDAGQLASLRLVVTGAERCPPRVHEAAARKCPRASILEGYGVTECGPVVSVNRVASAQPGTIGLPLPSVTCVIVHVETGEAVGQGQEGMLLVRGPSTFAGYLDYDGPSPFVEFDGRRWYRTGDLVIERDDGLLQFRGRLKRFTKLGGEMVSLPAIEAALEPHTARDDDDGPTLAIVATDDDRPEIVLFTTRDLDRGKVNEHIRAAGLSGLSNVRRIIRIEELPLLGTGKTDYRALAERLRESSE